MMTAKEILSNHSTYPIYTPDSLFHKDDVIQAMQEYARLQIEKDRERVKARVYKWNHISAGKLHEVIDQLPINLD